RSKQDRKSASQGRSYPARMTETSHRLDPLLKPRSIALLGASARPQSAGRAMVEMCCIDGFAGGVYLVNPNYQEISGRRCYASLADLPETVDHVVLGLANAQLDAGLKRPLRMARAPSPSSPPA